MLNVWISDLCAACKNLKGKKISSVDLYKAGKGINEHVWIDYKLVERCNETSPDNDKLQNRVNHWVSKSTAQWCIPVLSFFVEQIDCYFKVECSVIYLIRPNILSWYDNMARNFLKDYRLLWDLGHNFISSLHRIESIRSSPLESLGNILGLGKW